MATRSRSRFELEAEGILRALWPGDATGEEIVVPVDPVRIARDLGLEVFEVSLRDAAVSGMLLKKEDEPPRIYLNEDQHRHRKRFTCAHEIGHYVKRTIDGTSSAFEYIDRRDHLSSRGTNREERWANGFAAALLMPANFVLANFDHLGHTGLALELDVSLEAMGHRLTNLHNEGRR